MKNKLNTTSRTSNVIRNTWIGIISQSLILILSFISRTVFIKMLGNDYLSVNGLYSNIINTLSFVELGFGTALIYILYKPVAENDIKKTQSIIKFYQHCYSMIGLVMFILGLCVIPFMGYIIKEPPQISENLNIIYVLFLFSTCVSYFFAHKSAIINANQQNYIVTLTNQITKAVQTLIQVALLLLTRNYIMYLVIQIIMTILNNIIISIIANKKYSYIKEKNIEPIDEQDKKNVINKVKALITYRLGPAILNGTDNLILSSCIGMTTVGIYSNYYLITNYIASFLNQISYSMETSIGNLNAIGEPEQKEKVFYKIFYICFIIYGIVCILLMSSVNDFIRIWIGKEYLFNKNIVFSIVLYIYINGVQFPCYSYRTTSGLFDKNKIVPLVEVILNIVISITLAKCIGVAGVFLGTSISKLLTFFWTDPKLLYKYLFKNNDMLKYFKKYAYYMFLTLAIGTIISYTSYLLPVNNYLTWAIRTGIQALVGIMLFCLFTFKTFEYKETIYIIRNVINKALLKLKIKKY